jgi:hypothetical protein
VFIDRLVGLLALYRVVSGRIVAGVLFSVSSVINSAVVNRV